MKKFTVKSKIVSIEDRVLARMKRKGALPLDSIEHIQIIAFKEERRLAVYVTHKQGEPLKHLITYPFTGYSGTIGPKLVEGDGQIPEGIYNLEYLNPNSRFHLSMKISYPNEVDRENAKSDGRTSLGNDIFIHGKSSTIGCIPIGDKAIEELFYLVSNVGIDKVNVIIAPWDFRVKDTFPKLERIDWSDKLYQSIRSRIEKLNLQE